MGRHGEIWGRSREIWGRYGRHLRLGGQCDAAADEACPQVGVEDAAPVALHLVRVRARARVRVRLSVRVR